MVHVEIASRANFLSFECQGSIRHGVQKLDAEHLSCPTFGSSLGTFKGGPPGALLECFEPIHVII